MAVTENSYTGNGSTTNYSFTFPYLKSTDVQVQVDATVTTAWTFHNATTVKFNTAPANGAKIKILRKTNVDNLTATFYPGSAIKSEDLNDNYTQNLYSTQETSNRAFETTGGTITGNVALGEDVIVTFEGATDNAHEITLTVADPTADRTITLPNVTGTVVTTGDDSTVSTTMLAANAVITNRIADGNVTTAKLAADAVTSGKLADNAVVNANLTSDCVTSDNLADNSVTTVQITDANVTTAKIAADAVTGAKIADDAVDSEHLAADSIDAEHYAPGSVDTTAIADNAVTNAKMADDSVGADELIDSSIGTAALASNAVTLAKMADNSVGTSELVDTAVTTAKLANNAVTTVKITDSNITTAKINNDAVTQDKIADSAVGTSQLIDGEVNSNKLTNGAVGTVKLADNAVTSAKIANETILTANIAAGQITQTRLANNNVVNTAQIIDNAVTSAKIAPNAVTTTEIADPELTTLAGMQSGTASILASGTALAATTTEINRLCDGMDYETTISNTDVKYPTSGAVIDYVAAQIAPIGGLEVIATDAAFPNTQPSAGVIISIADAGGLVVNGSGTSTTGRTVGGSTVTINNINSQFNSTTIEDGVAMMVSSTGSGQIYNYHKATLREQDILSIASDIQSFGNRYRVASSAPTSSKDDGDLWFDTTNGKMMVYNANTTAWEEVSAVGSFIINTISSSGNTGGGSATFNGTAYRFVLSNPPQDAQQLLVSINGVIQKPNAGTSQPSEGFAISGNDIIFAAAPPSGSDYFITTLGQSVQIGTPSDNTVSTAKIQNLAVTTDKIAASAVTSAKLGGAIDFPGHIKVTDGNYLKAGTGGDLGIYHDGSHNYIKSANGRIYAQGIGRIQLQVGDGTNWENSIVSYQNASTDLYYDGSKKFETTSTGTNTVGIHIDDGANHDGDVNFYGVNYNIFWDKSANALKFTDNSKAIFGDHSGTGDLHIYHNGSHSYIDENGTGILAIRSNGTEVAITSVSGESMGRFINDGAVELYHNNVKKVETTSDGTSITGNLTITSTAPYIQFTDSDSNPDWLLQNSNGAFVFHDGTASRLQLSTTGNVQIPVDSGKLQFGAGNDLEIYHDGTQSIINDTANKLQIRSDLIQLMTASGKNEYYLTGTEDGAVELYYDNTWRFKTESWGVSVNGNLALGDDEYLNFGGNNDLQIYHDGSHSNINNSTGNLRLQTDAFRVNSQDNNESIIKGDKDGSVELYHNNSKKLETASYGIYVSGTSKGDNFGLNDNGKYYAGSGNDLEIYHTSNHSYIRNNTGDLYIQGNNSGTIVNNVVCQDDGSTELHYDSTKKLQTTSDGVRLDDNNHVSFGTGSDFKIHFDGSNSYIDATAGNVYFRGNSNEAMLQLHQNGTASLYYDNVVKISTESSGAKVVGNWTIQKNSGGDASGVSSENLLFNTQSGDIGKINCVSAGGGGPSGHGGKMRFYTKVNNGSLTERMSIDNSGDLFVQRIYDNTTSGGANVRVQSNGLLQRDTSSRRYKNTIEDATHGLADLNKLRSVTYKGNNDGDTIFGGLIAEEVHDAGLTEFVDYNNDNQPDALRYANMVSLCVKAIQELSAEVETLKTKVAALEAK